MMSSGPLGPLVILYFLCPAIKSGGVLCYTFELLSVCPSVCPLVRPSAVHLSVRSITLIPFEIISRSLAQI